MPLRSLTALILAIAALITAAFAFSTPSQAQDDSYVDLSIEVVPGVSWKFFARNHGTADAYGVTVDIEIADQTIHAVSERDFVQNTGATCSGNIPGTTCISGVWPVGFLGAGEEMEFAIGPQLASGLPCCMSITTNWSVPARAVIKNTVPVEEERFKGDNADVGWITVNQNRVGTSLAQANYWLAASVDDLLPDAGDTVKITLKAQRTGGTAGSVYGGKVRLRLDNGMGTPTATPPSGTTFAAATGLTRTWDWDFDLIQPTEDRTLEVSTTLDNPLPSGVVRSDLCLTAEMTVERPDDREPGDTTAEICLREDPVTLLQKGETDHLFTLYSCVGVTTYPCSSSDSLELFVNGGTAAANAGISRSDPVMDPGNVVVHVQDPGGRRVDGTTVSWRTAIGSDLGGVIAGENFDLTDGKGWSAFSDKVTATDIDGNAKPGTLSIKTDDGSVEIANADTGDFGDEYDADSTFTGVVVLHFGTLGTYATERTYKATHDNDTSGNDSDDVEYTATGSYIFQVGPVAELEVSDGAPDRAPAGTRAFTIVAVNNGPDDAPAAQVTMTSLNASDHVSHTASHGTFNSTTGIWAIGELREDSGYYRATGHHLGWPALTIITSAAVDTEITAAITNTQDYEVCIDSSGDDVDAASESACTGTTGNTWHTTPYYDYISDNSTGVTIKAKDGTGAGLPALQMAQEDTASIVVEWDPVGALNGRLVTRYEIEWSADGAANWQQLSGNVPENRYVDTGIGAGDTRYYRVRAVNDRGHKGPWSQPIKGTVPVPETSTATAGRPEAPVLTASLPEGADGRTQIDLGWEKPIENGAVITSYTLEVADSSNGPWAAPDPAPQLGGSDTSWSHTGLTGGTRKYYRMKATNSEGDSDWSDTIDATTRAPGKAGPPLNLQAAPDGDAAIDLMWDPPIDDGGSPIRYYEVQWSPNGTSGWSNAGRTPDAETRTFKQGGMRFGTKRYYRVAARNGVTLGEWSDPPAFATTLAGVPGMPNLTARAADANTIGLTWTVPADNGSAIIRYELEWSADGTDGSWGGLTNPSATDTSYNDGGLDPGTERHYRIRAVNGATPGEGSWSAVRSAVTPPVAPGAPTLRAEPNGQNAIDVIWEPPSDDGGADVTVYELHWSADGAENSYRILTNPPGSARSYTHSGLQPGTTRYYQLRARNRAGWGEWSQPASTFTLTGVPASPNLTVRANGASEIKLSWTKPDDRGSDILGYRLQQSDNGHAWHFLGGTIPPTDTEYVHTDLGGGTTKHYRVRALNGNGAGQWSQARSARTDAGGPDAPVLTLTVAGDNRIDLGWTVPADNGSPIRGYWVERSADGNEPWERLTSNNRTTTYSDTDLYRGMTRYYRVAATNGAGTGPYSEAKFATTTGDPATAPGPPTLLHFSDVSRNQVTIAWDPPEDDGGAPVTGYEYEVAPPCKDDPEANCGFRLEDIKETTGTSARVGGLSTDGDYFFRVRAVNPIGEGEWARDIQAALRPSTSARVVVSPTTITGNEGDSMGYTVRLSHAPPHPVLLYIQTRAAEGSDDLDQAVFAHQGGMFIPSGWTHPHGEDWSAFTHNWREGVRVSFTAPEDADAVDDIVVADHFVFPVPYGDYWPCSTQDTQEERDQCRQDWEDDWAQSPYRNLTGAGVKVTVRDND